MKVTEAQLNHRASDFDDAVGKALGSTGHSTAAAALPSLNLNCLRSVSSQIQQLEDGSYAVKLNKGISAQACARKVRASNVDIYDIEYSDDLEDSDLINVSSKPLWSVSKAGNTLQIQRVNK